MNLREVIERYANAVSSRDYWDNLIGDPRTRKRELDSATSDCEETGRLLDALIDEAEAALAYAEYQYQYDKGHGVLAWQQMVDYIGKRNKLWEEFVAARDKAMNQQ